MTSNKYEVIHDMPLSDLPKLINADIAVCELFACGVMNTYREEYEESHLVVEYLDFIYDAQKILHHKLHRIVFPEVVGDTVDSKQFFTADSIVRYSSIDVAGSPEESFYGKLMYSLKALNQVVEGVYTHPEVDTEDVYGIASFCTWFREDYLHVINMFEKELQENTLI